MMKLHFMQPTNPCDNSQPHVTSLKSSQSTIYRILFFDCQLTGIPRSAAGWWIICAAYSRHVWYYWIVISFSVKFIAEYLVWTVRTSTRQPNQSGGASAWWQKRETGASGECQSEKRAKRYTPHHIHDHVPRWAGCYNLASIVSVVGLVSTRSRVTNGRAAHYYPASDRSVVAVVWHDDGSGSNAKSQNLWIFHGEGTKKLAIKFIAITTD